MIPNSVADLHEGRGEEVAYAHPPVVAVEEHELAGSYARVLHLKVLQQRSSAAQHSANMDERRGRNSRVGHIWARRRGDERSRDQHAMHMMARAHIFLNFVFEDGARHMENMEGCERV